MLTPVTPPCYLILNQSGNCTQVDHWPWDSLLSSGLWKCFPETHGEFSCFEHQLLWTPYLVPSNKHCSVSKQASLGRRPKFWFDNPGGSVVICLKCREYGFNPWAGKIPCRRKWQSTPVFLPGNPVDRGAWWAIVQGSQKSDMTEWLNLSLSWG